MKTIGIDMRMLGNGHGGIGRYVFELTKNLLETDQNHKYLLFYNQDNSQEQDINYLKRHANTELVPTDIRHYSFGEQTSFLKILNKHHPDLMHFPNFNIPLFYKGPFVVTIHDLVHHKISGHKKSHLLHFYAYKKIIAAAAQKSRAIITVSQYSKKDIVKYLQVLPRKVEVIYEGASLPTDNLEETAQEVKKKYILNKPYFLFVGVLERKKNIVSLTRGLDVFLKKYKFDVDLVIAGKADRHYPEVKHKALDIKFNDHLVFTDYVSDRDLAGLYKGAYAFVSASLHEGFGLPGVEAMKFGLPLAVSNIEVFNEIYDNAAVYFNPLDTEDIAEKLNLLVKDKQFYAQMQQKSLQRSQVFDWKKTAEKTLEVYNEILNP
jgi:glycosyltransferase involved in cell wall biosynthesis